MFFYIFFMIPMIKISIVTPAFNPGNYIFKLYESLNNQTFKEFEWIIVDDASDEISESNYSKIKREANFKVIVLRNNVNLLQSKSKNIGLKHSVGDYIKFIDADDLIDENHLKNQLEIIELSSEKTAIFSPTANFYDDNLNDLKINNSYKTVICKTENQLERFLVYPFFHHCSCLFRKSDLEKIDGFDEDLVTDEDGDLILRLMLNKILFKPCEDSFYFYRHHNNSRVSRNDSNLKWENRYKVIIKIEPNLETQNLKESLAQRCDLLAIEAFKQKNEIYLKFFDKAKSIFSNYQYPGNKFQNYVRQLFGFKTMLYMKSILRK